MTKVTISPENPGAAKSSFRAATRGHESVGSTPGAALDALAEQLEAKDQNTFIVVRNMVPDEFFTVSQQRRLAELLASRRAALNAGRPMVAGEEKELEGLIDAELEGAARRAAAMISELQQ